MSKKKLFGLFLIFLFLIASESICIKSVNSESSKNPSSIRFGSLIEHEKIIIRYEENFTDYGFPGLGTEIDPYRIENFNITTSSNVGIYIGSINSHFIVQNCILFGKYSGIYIDECATNIAEISNTINNGISIYSTDSVEITNNECFSGSTDIIYLESSDNTIISYNTIQSDQGTETGLTVLESESCTITNNDIGNTISGLYLDHCPNSIIKDNNLMNVHNYGIYVYSSDGVLFDRNTCTNCGEYGIYSYSFGSQTITNNIISSAKYGIFLKSSMSSIIENNICNLNEYGIYTESSHSSLLFKNDFSMNKRGFILKLLIISMLQTTSLSQTVIMGYMY